MVFVKNKKFNLFVSLICIIVGISLITTSFLIGSESQIKTKSIDVKRNFSEILLEMKEKTEIDIDIILTEMENDPLDGLFMDLMPSPEEIFFAEWANDSFPDVHIPLIGHLVKSIGTSKVGDVDLDGQAPFADLNITSQYRPSLLSQKQCLELWNVNNSYSFVFKTSNIWLDIVEGDSKNFNLLKTTFNISQLQLGLINEWINVSINSWMQIFSQRTKTVNIYNPVLLFGFIGAGTVCGILGTIIIYFERRKR